MDLEPRYVCKECGLAVLVLAGGDLIRPCGHTCAVLASCEARLKGVSGLSNNGKKKSDK